MSFETKDSTLREVFAYPGSAAATATEVFVILAMLAALVLALAADRFAEKPTTWIVWSGEAVPWKHGMPRERIGAYTASGEEDAPHGGRDDLASTIMKTPLPRFGDRPDPETKHAVMRCCRTEAQGWAGLNG